MKKKFKNFLVTQGCQENPLKMSKTPTFRGVSWHPWVAQIYVLMKFNTDLEGKMSFIFLDKIIPKRSLCN